MPFAAFFDLDKTLISRTSSVAFANRFYKAGLVSRRAIAKLAWEHAKFMRRSGPEESMRLARLGLKLGAGQHRPTIQKLVTQHLHDVISPLTFPRGLDLVKQHRANGDLTVMVSSSPIDVVRPIADLYGMDYVIASVPEVNSSDRYTGNLQFFCYGDFKVIALQHFAMKLDIDLADCWGYSDSITDLPMLKSIGKPIVVNPDKELLTIAKTNKWQVERFDTPGYQWSHHLDTTSISQCRLIIPEHS